MHDFDELLQAQLDALERGADLESLLAQLPQEARDLEPLLRLAAAVRELPHPEPDLSQVQGRRKIERAARQIKSQPRPSSLLGRLQEEWQKLNLRPNWALVSVLAGFLVLITFTMTAAALLGLGLWIGSGSSHTATLMDIRGHVEVASAQDDEWKPAQNGDKLTSQDRIRTGDASSATLVFFEGSRTTLGANAAVSLRRVDGGRGKSLRVVLAQDAGRTLHSVVPLRGEQSSFIVFTPTGAASVHGTTFEVVVDSSDQTRFAVNKGRVLVSNDTSQVFVDAGQVIAAQNGQEMTDPGYQFILRGQLSARLGSTWIVAGVPLTVPDGISIDGSPQIGDILLVEGHLSELGDFIADHIEPADVEEQRSSFTGELQNMGDEVWQVSGWNILIDDDTELIGEMTLGMTVRVDFELDEDKRWIATRIEPLMEETEGNLPAASPTPIPGANPSLSFEPDELELETCRLTGADEFTFKGRLFNEGDEADDVASNVELDFQIIKGPEFVDRVSLDPVVWDEITAGEMVTFDVRVELNAAAWEASPEESEVKVRVFIAQETNREGGHPARLTVTIESDCELDDTPTPTPTITATPTITQTPTVTPTPDTTQTATPIPTATAETEEPDEFANCTGAQPHPTGMKLAQRYSVPYGEIMGWFCQGFGFGEIDLAYSLSQQSGVPVGEIFEMKRSGTGWGLIKQQLAPKMKKDNPGKGKP